MHDGLEQRLADTLGHRSVDLSFDDDRVDHASTVFHERIAAYRDTPCRRIDVDDRHVDRAREGRPGKVTVHGGLETGGQTIGEPAERR